MEVKRKLADLGLSLGMTIGSPDVEPAEAGAGASPEM
jgi:hypothetical protein